MTLSRVLLLSTKSSYQLLKSPPLLSLDLPDIWNWTSHNSQPPSSIPPQSTNPNEQTARVIHGKSIAEEINSVIASQVSRMKVSIGKVPGLAVILVGERKDSQAYVRNKIKACEEAGIKFLLTELPDKCTNDEVCDALSSFNKNPSVHGVLVQLPLPQHLDEGKILDMVSLEKDVDGFHPLNMGNLATRGREPLFIPCTPKGCIELLLRSDVEIMGKKAVVIGRSNIVGLPASLLLQVTLRLAFPLVLICLENVFAESNASITRLSGAFVVEQRHHATVSVVHAFTKNPEQITREADIVITAVGVPNLVRGSWLKPGSVVIDVGTFPVEDPSHEHGYRLMGDVCYEEAVRVASAITPVPGGVGPMTIAMLLSNTLDAAKRAYNFV